MRRPPVRRALPLALACALAAALACARHPAPAATPEARWLGTWMPSQQLTETRNLPPAPLANSTLRQVFRVSVGGPRIRAHFSNLFGNGPLDIRSARIARSVGAGSSALRPASERALTFGGADSVVLAAGEAVTADPLDFAVSPQEDLAVTLLLGRVPGDVTGHPGSRTTSYLQAGDHVAAPSLPDAVTTDHWYILAGLDVAAEGAAVVALGNSITDGRGSGTNRNDRWTDDLARRLQADPRTRHVAVLNAGLGGNRILAGGLGPTALSRFERDVLSPAGVRWVIVLEGVNDLGAARDSASAAATALQLIEAYRRFVALGHARGLRVYGGTITPFAGSMYGGAGLELARQTVNAWIRTSGVFDAVVDFDAAVRDPADPSRLSSEADSGDHLHPGERGYQLMADAIDLALFLR